MLFTRFGRRKKKTKKDNLTKLLRMNPSFPTLTVSGDSKRRKFQRFPTHHSSIRKLWKKLLNPLINALIKLVRNFTLTTSWSWLTWEIAKRKAKNKKLLLLFSDNFSRLWPDQCIWVQKDFSLNHRAQMTRCANNLAQRTLNLKWMKWALWKNSNWTKTDSFDPSVNVLRTMKKTLSSVRFVLRKENCNDFLFYLCWFFIKNKKNSISKPILLFPLHISSVNRFSQNFVKPWIENKRINEFFYAFG